jgi:hypothetical protein
MPGADPIRRLNIMVRIAAVAALLLGGYYVWSFFVSSRYQALCGKSYWELTPAQIESCKELKSELDNK